MITEPEIRTLNYYEELDLLFNYIDYQIRKQKFALAGQTVIEFYDILACESYLKSKSSTIFKEYNQIAKNVNIDPTNQYELVCLLYIYSRNSSNMAEDVWDKFSNEINKIQKGLDIFYLFAGDNYYPEYACEKNPSAKNLYLLACEENDTFNEFRSLLGRKQRIEKKISRLGPSNASLIEELSDEIQEMQDEIRYYKKEVNASIDVLKKAVKKDSNHFFSYNLLGELYVLKDENQLAKDCFLECLKIYPNYYKALLNLLNLYSNSGDIQSIIEQFNKIQSFKIYVDEHYYQIGRIAAIVMAVYWKLELFEKAKNIFMLMDDLLSDYAKKRNEKTKYGKLRHHNIMTNTQARYLSLIEDSPPKMLLKLLTEVIGKNGDNARSERLIKSYLNTYLLENSNIDLKQLSLEEIEKYCNKDDKLLSSDEFDEYEENDELNFGKYKGKTIRYVIDNDFQYLSWSVNNIGGFYLSHSILFSIIRESGTKYLSFILMNMAKYSLSRLYAQREYALEEEMKRASDEFKEEMRSLREWADKEGYFRD
ncbi:hypothetical protein [Maribellus sediminis]|uniref:exodeoxyribonuclease X C-terminal domain-containing protein n=1 Tax=Maribellus sediminis TaxID=2696285 RepID=UPI00143018E5|nr:hypothetical protein [Maribellus sediminis]